MIHEVRNSKSGFYYGVSKHLFATCDSRDENAIQLLNSVFKGIVFSHESRQHFWSLYREELENVHRLHLNGEKGK